MNTTTSLHKLTFVALLATVVLSYHLGAFSMDSADAARVEEAKAREKEAHARAQAREKWKTEHPASPEMPDPGPGPAVTGSTEPGTADGGAKESSLRLQGFALFGTAGMSILAMFMVLLFRTPAAAWRQLRAIATCAIASAVIAASAALMGFLRADPFGFLPFRIAVLLPPVLLLSILGIAIDVRRSPATGEPAPPVVRE